MSVKFLFLLDLKPSRNSFFCLSLKTGNQVFSLLIIFMLITAFIIDYKSHSDQLFTIIFEHLAFSLPIIIASFYIYKSTKNLTYFDSYIAHLLLSWNLLYHFICAVANFVFDFKYSAVFIDNWLGNKTDSEFVTFWIPQILLLVFEFYFLWICYSYTKNLCEGNDALVDGQNFDKYYENFASNPSSQREYQLNNLA
jgi:hypothetical protein